MTLCRTGAFTQSNSWLSESEGLLVGVAGAERKLARYSGERRPPQIAAYRTTNDVVNATNRSPLISPPAKLQQP